MKVVTERLVVALLSLALALPMHAADKESKNKGGKKDPDAIGERDVGGGMNFYSLEKEIALGKSMAQQVERNSRIIDDPIISEYVNRVGQNLVRNSDAKVPFTIKLVDDESVNAFALPGGFFFVNTGLFLRADNEAELAGVMAHEIAHVAARHGTKQATRGQLINYASIPLIFMGGWTGYGIRQAASFAIPMGFLQFSRGAESEADLLGLQYMYKTGYDPTSFVDFFEKLLADQKRKPGTLSKLFASHPPTGDRITQTQERIEELLPSKPQYVVTSSEFLDVQARLASLTRRTKSQDDKEEEGKPTLRRNPSDETIPVDGEPSDEPEEDERPTLKRR
ncbi:MAG: M48 family metallopeptidase [Acidobacteria bacterium]|nr:M48 family metallopeptidase [Acidobacteriota bacterium]